MSIKKEKTRKRRRPYKLIVKQLRRQGIKAKVVKRSDLNRRSAVSIHN